MEDLAQRAGLSIRLFCGVTQIDLALNRMVETGALASEP
jgi:hypothetical protein